jgi:hypothetical protein
MHRVLFAAALLLITASGASAEAVRPNPSSVGQPTAVKLATEIAEPSIEVPSLSLITVKQTENTAETTAAREVSARNVFAIVGVLVVVVALIALLS